MNELLSSFDWDVEFIDLSVNEAYNRLLSIISSLGKSFAPCRSNYCQNVPHKPWKYKPPKNVTSSRSLAWKNYSETRATNGRNSMLSKSLLTSIINIETMLFKDKLPMEISLSQISLPIPSHSTLTCGVK